MRGALVASVLLGPVLLGAAGCGDGSTLGGADLASTAPVDLAGLDLTGVDLASAPVAGEPAGLTGITAAHNAARAQAQPTPSPALGPLAWDDTLAQAAQGWAGGCQFKHSGGAYGENLYASAGTTPTGASVVADWVGEAKDYTYATNTCAAGKPCGHYTQVVWRDTTKLGCAITSCSTNSPFGSKFPTWNLVVCEYDPPGNFNGKKPY
jgi:hypothetical protein